MEEKQKDSILALKNLCSYNKKLINGIEQVIDELRGTKKPDTDEFLAQIIKGICWNIETLNQISPIINEQEELIEKDKMNNGITTFNQAIETADSHKIADALEFGIKSLLLHIEQVYVLVSA